MTTPDGPADRRNLRVSDAEREHAADVLRRAAGDGRITFEELDDRLTAAYAARTYGELAAITEDLPEAGPQPPATGDRAAAASRPSGTRFPESRIGGTPGSAISVAVMSEAHRSGGWVVPPSYTAVAIMGAVSLDLRDARFSGHEVTIQTFALMGGIDIIVDEEITVDVSGFAFMGGFDHRATGPGLPGAPRLKVVGFALMGGVNVQRRPPRKKKPRETARTSSGTGRRASRVGALGAGRRRPGPVDVIQQTFVPGHIRRTIPVALDGSAGKAAARRDGMAARSASRSGPP